MCCLAGNYNTGHQAINICSIGCEFSDLEDGKPFKQKVGNHINVINEYATAAFGELEIFTGLSVKVDYDKNKEYTKELY